MKRNFYSLLLCSLMFMNAAAQESEFKSDVALLDITVEASSRSGEVMDVIKDAPGTTSLYMKECEGYFRSYTGKYAPYADAEIPAKIVWDGDNVYFYNILSKGLTDSYVKGHREGDKIIVPLPQTLLYNQSLNDGYNLERLKYTEVENNGETHVTFTIDREGDQFFTYSIAEDGTVTLDDMGEGIGIGMVFISDDQWNGYVDFKQAFTPIDRPMVEKPADLQTEQWALTFNGSGYYINVGFSGDDVYIGGMCGNLREAYFKGHIEGDKIVVPNKQLVGIYSDTYYVYLMTGSRTTGTIELSPEDTGFIMNFDAENKKMTPCDPEQLLIFNASPSRVLVLQMFQDFALHLQTNCEGTPQNPFNLWYTTDNYEWYGFNSFNIDIPCLGTNGNILDENYLYYNILMDGEVMVFSPGEYDVTTEMTDIPYLYDNGNDIYSYGGSGREIGIYPESGFDTLGVQLFYNYNGILTTSAIATLNIATGDVSYDTSGVNGVSSELTVAKREFFDLAGRKVAHPERGSMYIEHIRFSDGSSVSVKSVVR